MASSGRAAEPVDPRMREDRSLQLVGLTDARNRPVAAYSKGMRQRVKLAQSTAHDPPIRDVSVRSDRTDRR